MSASAKIHAIALKAATTLTIASGVVTTTQNVHIVAAESSTTDDLDTITLGYDILTVDTVDYWPIIILQADSGDTITLKHGTGNIDLPGDADIPLGDDEWILLMWNGTNWQTISGVAFS